MDKLIKIPEFNDNIISRLTVNRLPVELPGVISAAEIGTEYGFNPDDIELKWPITVYRHTGDSSDDDCDASGVGSDDTSIFTYINTVRGLQGGRPSPWMLEAEVGDSGLVYEDETAGITKGPALPVGESSAYLITPPFIPSINPDAIGGGGGGDDDDDDTTQCAYNGYFTIKVRNGKDGKPSHIVVCDGATYDAEKHTSGVSIVRVNQVVFTVPYTELLISEGYVYIVIIYTPPRLDANGNVIDHGNQSVSIQALKNIEDDTRTYYILGNYSYVNGVLKVIQRHGTVPTTYMSNGVADIEYFIKC